MRACVRACVRACASACACACACACTCCWPRVAPHTLHASHTLQIVPEESQVLVRSDSIRIMLRKVRTVAGYEPWSGLAAQTYVKRRKQVRLAPPVVNSIGGVWKHGSIWSMQDRSSYPPPLGACNACDACDARDAM